MNFETLVRRYGSKKNPKYGQTSQKELASLLWQWALEGESWAVRELLARLWPVNAKVELSGSVELTDSDREVIDQRFGKLLRLRGDEAA